ncbi:MAG TPA: DUF1707 domain-containing protein [Mycobacterium sp.]|nr:DUF1707 domain-containing protein [Mycobacterium sp.]
MATTATRAKDTDRADTCRILDKGLEEGQLSMAEHQERISAATNAVTLGDLHGLVADLQTASAPVQLRAVARPLKFGGRGIAAAALAVAVLLGIGIGWGVYGNTSSPLNFTSDPGAKPDGVAPVVLTPPKQLHSLGGLTGLLEQARKKFGETMGYRLVVYPEYALLDRADPKEERRQLSYSYRGGWGDPTSSARSGDAVVVDLSRFDPKAAVGILRGAPETVGIKPPDVTATYLIVGPAQDPTTPEALSLSVYVSSDYGSGYIEFAGDGTVKRVSYPS